jgi:hypothetical protein
MADQKQWGRVLFRLYFYINCEILVGQILAHNAQMRKQDTYDCGSTKKKSSIDKMSCNFW